MKTIRKLLTMLLVLVMGIAFQAPYKVAAAGPTLSLKESWYVYDKNSDISFTYSGVDGSSKAWIGIYKAGEKPGTNTPALSWKEVPQNNKSDNTYTMTFLKEDLTDNSACQYSPEKGLYLPRGKYEAMLFADGGYTPVVRNVIFWVEGDAPISSFDVISDSHVVADGCYDNYNGAKKLQKAITDINSYSKNSSAIVMNGDLVDSAKDSAYKNVSNAIIDGINDSKSRKKLPFVFFNLGNHELMDNTTVNQFTSNYDDKFKMFKSNTKLIHDNLKKYRVGVSNSDYNMYSNLNQTNKPYYEATVGKNHFLFLASQSANAKKNSAGETMADIRDEQITWVNNRIYDLAMHSPNEPIFVFLHESFQNTVGGSKNPYIIQENELLWQINKYPTVTIFTSHTHEDGLENNWYYTKPQATKGGGVGVSMFNSISVGDIWKYGSDFGDKDYSEGLHVDVYDDSIVVRCRDFYKKKWIGEYKVDLKAKLASLNKAKPYIK